MPTKKPAARPTTTVTSTRRPAKSTGSARTARAGGDKTAKVDGDPVVDDEILIDVEDPPEQVAEAAEADWADINLEEPLDLLEGSMVAIELSEDPVRLYLKEIGQINLLDADSEFRLAARIEAHRHLELLEKHQALDGQRQNKVLYGMVARDMVTSWTRLVEDAHSLQQGTVPDLSLTLAEAQMLRQNGRLIYLPTCAITWTTACGVTIRSGMGWCGMRLPCLSACTCCPPNRRSD